MYNGGTTTKGAFMGATDFYSEAHGGNVKEAFYRAVDQAAYDYGHSGYTGTIAEKNEYTVFDLPEGLRVEDLEGFFSLPGASKFADETLKAVKLMDERTLSVMGSVYEDKWGPCVAIRVTGDDEKAYRERCKVKGDVEVWAFMGVASS